MEKLKSFIPKCYPVLQFLGFVYVTVLVTKVCCDKIDSLNDSVNRLKWIERDTNRLNIKIDKIMSIVNREDLAETDFHVNDKK